MVATRHSPIRAWAFSGWARSHAEAPSRSIGGRIQRGSSGSTLKSGSSHGMPAYASQCVSTEAFDRRWMTPTYAVRSSTLSRTSSSSVVLVVRGMSVSWVGRDEQTGEALELCQYGRLVSVGVVVQGVLQREPDQRGEQGADHRARRLVPLPADPPRAASRVQRRGEEPVERLQDHLHGALVDVEAERPQCLVGASGHGELHQRERRRLPEGVPEQVERSFDVAPVVGRRGGGPLVREPLSFEGGFGGGG